MSFSHQEAVATQLLGHEQVKSLKLVFDDQGEELVPFRILASLLAFAHMSDDLSKLVNQLPVLDEG